MESLRNEPVYLGGTPSAPATIINTPSTGAGYGDGLGGGGLLSTVLLASLLGRNGLGGGLGSGDTTSGAALAYAQRAADNSSTILAALGKSEGDIKEAFNSAIARTQIETSAHFSDLNNRLCDNDKEVIKAGYEARLESLQTKADLLANQNANTIAIKDDIKDFRFSVDKQFCETNSNIDKQFCTLDHKMEKGFERIIEREYKERIAQLEDKLNQIRFNETQRELDSIKHDTSRAMCALGKIAPTVTTTNALSGCC